MCTTSLILLISFTAGIYLFDFVLLWLLYKWFGGCFFNVFLLVLFIAVAIIFTTLTALRTRENASILTNGIVLSYILYLTWAALASDPDEKCNTLMHSQNANIVQVILGVAFTVISILIFPLIIQDGGSSSSLSDEEQPLDEVDVGGKKVDVEDSYIFPLSYETIYFHVMMMCASCYYAMLLSNWNDLGSLTAHPDPEKDEYFTSTKFSLWMKLFSKFCCYLIFLWSLIGPLILPDADWDI